MDSSTFGDYDGQHFDTKLESVPARGDTPPLPMQIPPLPTQPVSQPGHLDISHREEEGGQSGSGRGDGGSSDDSDGSSSGVEVPETTSRPSWPQQMTAGLLGVTPDHVTPKGLTPEPGLPAVTPYDDSQQPAVVFKEEVSPSVFDPVHSLDLSAGGDSSAKPPLHVIIVNVLNQNQSGELTGQDLIVTLHLDFSRCREKK